MPLTRLLAVLLPALAVAAGNWAVAGIVAPGTPCTTCLAWLVGAPVVLALLLAVMLPRLAAESVAPVAVAAAPPPPPPPPREPEEAPALRLLGMLQQEGRFIDFIAEDLSPYPDDQIGAAARGIHEGCRKVLREHVDFEPVLRANEGDNVTVEPGFDPAAIRLTGNVSGTPPFHGVLRHAGWRVRRADVPARRGQDPQLLAPAEVEIP
jgi:Domain of unknown function (DUF2760)